MRIIPNQVGQQFKCFEGGILSLSQHPLNENLLMASCVNGYKSIFESPTFKLLIHHLLNDRKVSTFDLRYMQPVSDSIECTDPVYSLPHVVTRVSGAFFSPLTGDYALVTGRNASEILNLRTSSTECNYVILFMQFALRNFYSLI